MGKEPGQTTARTKRPVVIGVDQKELKKLFNTIKPGIDKVANAILLNVTPENKELALAAVKLLRRLDLEDGSLVDGLTPEESKLLVRAASYGLEDLQQALHHQKESMAVFVQVHELVRTLENSGVLMEPEKPADETVSKHARTVEAMAIGGAGIAEDLQGMP